MNDQPGLMRLFIFAVIAKTLPTANHSSHLDYDPAIELPLFNYTPYLFDINKAKNYLDFKPTPLDQWVQITTSWYQSQYNY